MVDLCRLSYVSHEGPKLILNRYYHKFQNTNTKFQTNPNNQNSKFKIPNLSMILKKEHPMIWSLDIEIWDLFVFWCLEFEILRFNKSYGQQKTCR